MPPPGFSTIAFDGPETINGKPAIYLTFDDGPEPGSTNLVLDALAKTNTPATFFTIGSIISDTAASKALVKREIAQGSTVGAHGWLHLDMSKWTRAADREALTKVKNEIEKVTGLAPTCSRPPYGSYSGNLSWETSHLGMRIQRWTGDTEDWARPDPDAIMKTITKSWKPGYVILLHDGGNHGAVTAQVVPRIVAEAKKRGYVIGNNLCPMTTDLNLTTAPLPPTSS